MTIENGGKIFKALCDAQREIDAIDKSRTNDQQKFKFRGIDDVYNSLHPLLAKYNIFTAPEVIEDRSEERTTKSGSALIYRILKVRVRFYSDDGSYFDTVVIGEGMDSGDKASNKAMSIAHKYALLQVFTIPTIDLQDPDGESHEVQTKKTGLEFRNEVIAYINKNKELFSQEQLSELRSALPMAGENVSKLNDILSSAKVYVNAAQIHKATGGELEP